MKSSAFRSILGGSRWKIVGGLAGTAVALILLTQCTRVEVRNRLTQPQADLFWPQGGDVARVRFIASIRSPDDLFVRRGWPGVVNLFAGKEDRSFGVPFDIHLTRDGLLLVTDPGKGCVHFIDMSQYQYRAVSDIGGRSLEQPIGVTADEKGHVFVSDSMLGNVFVFDRRGSFLRPLTRPGVLKRPADLVYCAKTGFLYIADVLAHQVKVLRPDGTLVRAIGGRGVKPGNLNYPTHLWVDNDGILYVTSAMDFAITVFDASGRALTRFGQEGDTPGYFSRPKGVATDREGHIYVVDAILDNFQIFDRRGSLLLTVGQSGAGPGEFWLPAGIFIDSRNRIFVADQQNHRIEVFQYAGVGMR